MPHTPGPFKLGIGMSNMGSLAIERHDGVPLAFVCGNDFAHNAGHPVPHDEAVANANLFCAAPEMLSALKACLAMLDGAEVGYKAWKAAKEAIDKAEGKLP